MNERKIEQLYQLAERIVNKAMIKDTVFSESAGSEYLGEDFPRDLVAAITDGLLRGRTFRTILPISGQVYRDEEYRQMIRVRCCETWRRMAMGHLVPMTLLIGPKGKLPA